MKSLFPILLLMSLTTITFANNVLPVANITSSQGTIKANKLHTKEGIMLNFSGASSYDPDGGGITYYWWYVNGSLKSQGSSASSFNWSSGNIYYGAQTSFTVMLKVRDNENTTKTRTITVYVVDEERNYFVTDHLGNVRATVNQNGDVIGYDDYYPYGQVMPDRSSNTANANDIYKFTGHERDAELGLDYMLARNYDPEIGRFLSVDPLYDKRAGLSPYNYAQNNPIIRWDPSGKLDVEVQRNDKGTYTITGGTANDDKNIYVVENGQRTGEVIGQTLTTHSFHDSESGQAVVGAVIDPNDNSGIDYLNNEVSETTAVSGLAFRGGGNMDFKARGTEGMDGASKQLRMHRGMPAIRPGIFASARDIGNVGAGIVAGRSGASLSLTRTVFDYVNGGPEPTISRLAQDFGWKMGVYLRMKTDYK